MTIRIRRVADYRAAAAMDLLLFPGDDPIDDPDSHIWFVGFEAGKPVCYASLKLLPNESSAFLSRCGVLRSHRGQGLQKRLLRARERAAKAEGCTGHLITYTVPENAPSINSLTSCGFKAYIPPYNWAGDDVVYFRKKL
jgi:GNAT superfamily N-acetyltransferase